MRTRLTVASVNETIVEALSASTPGVSASAAPLPNLVLVPALVESPAPAMPADAVPGPTMPPAGDVAAGLRIPKIGVDVVTSAGTDTKTLKRGPGIWLPGVMPGEAGNATISGHRTTYGAPFRHLDDLVVGDQIFVDVPGQPEAVYEVRASFIVSPDDVAVTNQTDGVRLTLTTCDPVGSDADRLVIQAELVAGAQVADAIPAANWAPQR